MTDFQALCNVFDKFKCPYRSQVRPNGVSEVIVRGTLEEITFIFHENGDAWFVDTKLK